MSSFRSSLSGGTMAFSLLSRYRRNPSAVRRPAIITLTVVKFCHVLCRIWTISIAPLSVRKQSYIRYFSKTKKCQWNRFECNKTTDIGDRHKLWFILFFEILPIKKLAVAASRIDVIQSDRISQENWRVTNCYQINSNCISILHSFRISATFVEYREFCYPTHVWCPLSV